jgi:hypothetical protein
MGRAVVDSGKVGAETDLCETKEEQALAELAVVGLA